MTEIFPALGPYWAFAFTYHYEQNQCNQCLFPLTALAETQISTNSISYVI